MIARHLIPAVCLVTLSACPSGNGPTSNPPPGDPVVTSILVSPGTQSITVGATATLAATVRDAAGQTMTGQTIEWQSSNGAIASVSGAGLVTGVSAGGPVSITARIGTVTGSAQVTVTDLPVATVTIAAPQTTLRQGGTTQLTVETRAAGGQVLSGRAVTWGSSNEAVATVSQTGLVTAVAIGGPVTITATSEGRSGTVAITVTFPPLAQGWQHRRPITITTGTSAAETGYSIPITFDHQALVTAGKSLASGDDVRVGYWNGNAWVELDRVLDAGSVWNSATTRIWFRTQVPIAASATSISYHLHYGNAAAGSPPRNPDLVYLFSDDFEDGTLTRWTQDNDQTWQNVSTRAHRGTRAVYHGPEDAEGRGLVAAPALDERDVMFEAWWNVSSLDTDFNTSQMPRRVSGAGQYYTLFCECLSGAMGFDIASFLADTWTELRPPAGSPQPDTWMRVGTAMHGSTYRLFLNGAEMSMQTDLDALTSGNVGFSKFIIPPGDGVWHDDVVARRYVFPEPVPVLGAET